MTLSPPAEPPSPQVPTSRARRYRQNGWWRHESVGRLVLGDTDARAGEVALVDADGSLTYRELVTAVERAAGRLRLLGVRAGQPVIVALPNCTELVVLVLALIRLGSPPVLSVPSLRFHELDHVLTATEAVAIATPRRLRRFDHLELADSLRQRHPSVRFLLVRGDGGAGEVDLTRLCDGAVHPEDPADMLVDLPEPAPSDIAVLLLSSGTTGPPKAIPRRHEGYGYMLRVGMELARLGPDSVYLAAMPATHGFVLGCPGILGTLAAGGRVVLDEAAQDPARALALIRQQGVTHCAVVPALAKQWIAAARSAGEDVPRLEVLQVGGARMHETDAVAAEQALGCRVQQVYGMSEGLLNFTRLDDPDEVRFDTQGRPASPGDELLVVGEDGRPVRPGERGELLTRGPYTIPGYYRDPVANAKSFTPEGFYRTGDLVRLLPSGNLVVDGRVHDVINRGGEKISVEELECLLAEDPSIAAAAVVAMPHHVLGETVCLFAVPAGDTLELRDVRAYLDRCGVAKFKLPEHLEIVDSLPMKGIGKIDRVTLRSRITEQRP
ncbi:MAG TPA: AMP-binding protein [Amycolatopsis sp.]|nr:AMP-binding protein [Amycolatopsis sp.]